MASTRRASGGKRVPRIAQWGTLAYALGGLTVATTMFAFVLQLVDVGRPNVGYAVDPFLLIVPIVFAAAGAFIASRRPANPIGWLFLFSGAWGAVGSVSNLYLGREPPAAGAMMSAYAVLRSVNEWAWVPVIVPVVAFVPMFFPDGRLPSARWRAMPALGLVGAVAIAMAITLSPPDDSARSGPNPYAVDAPWVGALLVAGLALFLVATVLAVASLLVRMRRGTRIERQQLKIFFYAAIVYPAAGVLAALTGWEAFQQLAVLGVVAVPIAVAIAILRYRLYDIDVLIRRTVIYALLSAVLFLAYAGGVAVMQFVFSPVTSGNGLAVAISTLVVVALFQPLRRRIQSSVDRRFYRRRYDVARTLDSFAVRLRDEIDLDALQAELIRAVGDTLQPTHASLWLRGTR